MNEHPAHKKQKKMNTQQKESKKSQSLSWKKILLCTCITNAGRVTIVLLLSIIVMWLVKALLTRILQMVAISLLLIIFSYAWRSSIKQIRIMP